MKEQLFTFIQKSPTAFHATKTLKEMLIENGFEEIREYQIWKLKHNKKYFVTRNDSSMIAFTTPKHFKTIQVAASHLDSPTFKVKDNGEIIDTSQIKLNVERYGVMILSSWFDRPLSLAGRVIVDNQGLRSQLVDIDEDTILIPNVGIHLNRSVNEGYTYNIQKEVAPIIGQGEAFSMHHYLSEKCQIEGDIVGSEIFLYNRQLPTTWGVNQEFIGAPRIDNLECTFALIEALLRSNNTQALNICAMFDNEEVGSTTKQGADSSFLEDTLRRIKECFALSEQEYLSMLAKGFMISADNAHGYHPNYSELYDPTNHPVLNGGVVIKHNANQKYTTDGISASIFRKLCQNANVAYQDFYNHSNTLGGSTLGNISNTHVSLHTVDIGLAQWAMHSAYESAGSRDLEELIKVMTYFYNHTLEVKNSVLKM